MLLRLRQLRGVGRYQGRRVNCFIYRFETYVSVTWMLAFCKFKVRSLGNSVSFVCCFFLLLSSSKVPIWQMPRMPYWLFSRRLSKVVPRHWVYTVGVCGSFQFAVIRSKGLATLLIHPCLLYLLVHTPRKTRYFPKTCQTFALAKRWCHLQNLKLRIICS